MELEDFKKLAHEALGIGEQMTFAKAMDGETICVSNGNLSPGKPCYFDKEGNVTQLLPIEAQDSLVVIGIAISADKVLIQGQSVFKL